MKTTESKYCQCLYFTTNALARKVEKLACDCYKPVDLSPSHAYLLMMVIEEPGVQPGCLAHHLQLSPSTVTRLIEKLEEKKLVSRLTEGKTTNVFPTDNAKNIMPLIKNCQHQFYMQYSDILGKEESKKMVQSMGKLADKLVN